MEPIQDLLDAVGAVVARLRDFADAAIKAARTACAIYEACYWHDPLRFVKISAWRMVFGYSRRRT
jgi:hypothetical protein